jgi:hypothetical protein
MEPGRYEVNEGNQQIKKKNLEPSTTVKAKHTERYIEVIFFFHFPMGLTIDVLKCHIFLLNIFCQIITPTQIISILQNQQSMI